MYKTAVQELFRKMLRKIIGHSFLILQEQSLKGVCGQIRDLESYWKKQHTTAKLRVSVILQVIDGTILCCIVLSKRGRKWIKIQK